MQRVLLSEPVIKYEDFFTYSALTQPKTCRGLAPLDHMDDAILIDSNKIWFHLLFSTYLNMPDRAKTARRADV